MSSEAATTKEDKQAWVPGLLAIAGAVSGAVTVFLLSTTGLMLFLGILFGGIMAASLMVSGTLGARGAGRLVVIAAVTYPISLLASVGAQLALGSLGLLSDAEQGTMSTLGIPSPIAVSVGGAVGGLLLGCGVLIILRREPAKPTLALNILAWLLVGGASALLGCVLGPWLGTSLSHLSSGSNSGGGLPTSLVRDFGPAPLVYSVHIFWQTGMALLIGLTVKRRGTD